MDNKIKNKIIEYYNIYYNDELKIPNYEHHINKRLNEDKKYLNNIKSFLEEYNLQDIKKVLIVGTGTGGEMFAFHNLGYEVYGVEPYNKAIDILHLKAQKYSFDTNNITECGAEVLPFDDNSFDLVYCYTVLEHVQDVKKSLQEMYRVVNKKGKIYLSLPNYTFPFEEHYKIPVIPPKFSNKLFELSLKFFKRPLSFANSLNFLSIDDVNKCLMKLNILNYKRSDKYFVKSRKYILLWLYSKIFKQYATQELMIVKD